MTNYTQNNHLKYTIGSRMYGYRSDPAEVFNVTVGSVDMEYYKKTTYREELRRTADSVYNEFGKDLVVFLSGGTDSEIVIRNFLEIGVKPRCVAIRFDNDYNLADINEAEAIARDLDLDLEILDFDVYEFYNSGEAKSFGEEVQCTQITYLMVYYHILKLGLPSVMGGEVLYTRGVSPTDSYWYYTFRENEDASAMRFSEKYNIPLVNEWFSYTPELLLLYTEDIEMNKLFTERFNYKLTSVSTKNGVLKRLYPDIRVKKKTHGFERLLGLNQEAYKVLGYDQIRRHVSSIDGIKIDTFIKMLKGEIDGN